MAPTEQPRYLLVGAGTRAHKFWLPGLEASVVAVMDSCATQLAATTRRWPVTTYHSTDMAQVMAETRPDTVLIATPDHAHFDQICTALRFGARVLAEKPMVLTPAQAATVIDLLHQTGGTLSVAHNMRFMNLHHEIHRLLSSAAIGTITHAALSYRLRPGHGRSYFTRWHRHVAASGGLAITKGCHHFDLLNWWLNDLPTTVTGWSRRAHYHSAATDPDKHVPDDADIADEIGALIHYRRGATATYTLTAHAAWEGYTLTLHGSAGELEARWDKDPDQPKPYTITLRPVDKPAWVVVVAREAGAHAGADTRMLNVLIHSKTSAARGLANAVEAGYAVAVGDALNRSAAAGGAPVTIDELEPPP